MNYDLDLSGGGVGCLCRRYLNSIKMRRKTHGIERGDCHSYVRRVRLGLGNRRSQRRIFGNIRGAFEIVDIFVVVGRCYGCELDMLFQGVVLGRSVKGGGRGQIERRFVRIVRDASLSRRTYALVGAFALFGGNRGGHVFDDGYS